MSSDDPLFRMSNCIRIEFIDRSLECLHTDKIPDIPYFDDARNVSSDNLRRTRETFDSYKWMVVALEEEYLLLDISVPHISLMVQAGTQQTLVEWTVFTPGQRVDSFVVTGEFLLESVGGYVPQTYLAIQTGTDQSLLA